MKRKNKIAIIISFALISVVGIKFTPQFNLINFQIQKFLSRDTINNIIKRGYLDEVWDFEKVVKPDKSGYYMWVIGLEAEDMSAVRVASGVVVGHVVFSNKELNMNYKSMEDYYSCGGAITFRNFIEKNNKNAF